VRDLESTCRDDQLNSPCTPLAFTEALTAAGIAGLIGSVGDAWTTR
jgi:hypothetical protein